MPQDPIVRERARKMAQQVRVDRAQMKRQMKAGQVDWYDLFCGNVPEWEHVAKKTKIRDLLLAVPGIGPTTADELLAEVNGIEGHMRTVGLTYALRQQIADLAKRVLSSFSA